MEVVAVWGRWKPDLAWAAAAAAKEGEGRCTVDFDAGEKLCTTKMKGLCVAVERSKGR